MTDITERLRVGTFYGTQALCDEAADTIDALRAEVARLGTEYRTASGLVHDMYSASTGRAGRLPKLGWLEDVVSAQTELRAEVERLRKSLEAAHFTDEGGELWKPPIPKEATVLVEMLQESQAEVARLRADAERYQWLTKDNEWLGDNWRHAWDNWDGSDGKAGFDAAIDAARTGAEG